MAQHYENNPIHGAVELLRTNGFDALAEAVTVLLNTAMVAERSEYLGAAPYERSVGRLGYANGYKDKQLKTRLGTLPPPPFIFGNTLLPRIQRPFIDSHDRP